MSDQVQAILLGLARHGVTALGVWLAAGGLPLTGTQLDTLTGALVVALSLGWSAVQKRWDRRNVVAAAVASAEKGVPVTVTVTPKDEPNIVVPIPREETATAPVVPPDFAKVG